MAKIVFFFITPSKNTRFEKKYTSIFDQKAKFLLQSKQFFIQI